MLEEPRSRGRVNLRVAAQKVCKRQLIQPFSIFQNFANETSSGRARTGDSVKVRLPIACFSTQSGAVKRPHALQVVRKDAGCARVRRIDEAKIGPICPIAPGEKVSTLPALRRGSTVSSESGNDPPLAFA